MEYDRKGELYAKIDYKKCINCFCCQEVCPFNVVKVKVPVGYKIIQSKQIRRDKKQKKLAEKNANKTEAVTSETNTDISE